MSEVDFNYLSKKYGIDEKFQAMLKDKDYRNIMQNIFDVNIKDIHEKAGEKSRARWDEAMKKPSMPPVKYHLPDLQDLLPERELVYAKAFERASSVSAKIRIELANRLREIIAGFEPKHKTKTYLNKRINPKLEDEVEENIRDFFRGYTKKDPETNMPPNVYTIAVTEVRSAINNGKAAIASRVKELNPQLPVKKRWIHNPHLSKNREDIRIGHAMTNGKVIRIEELFKVPIYRKIKGVARKVGEGWMNHPHDQEAPAEQIVNCHCDIEYFI